MSVQLSGNRPPTSQPRLKSLWMPHTAPPPLTLPMIAGPPESPQHSAVLPVP